MILFKLRFRRQRPALLIVGEPTRAPSWILHSVLHGHSSVKIPNKSSPRITFSAAEQFRFTMPTQQWVPSLADRRPTTPTSYNSPKRTGLGLYVARAIVRGLVMEICLFPAEETKNVINTWYIYEVRRSSPTVLRAYLAHTIVREKRLSFRGYGDCTLLY